MKRADFVHQLVLKLATTDLLLNKTPLGTFLRAVDDAADRIALASPFDDDWRVTGPFFLVNERGEFWSDELRAWGAIGDAVAHDRKTCLAIVFSRAAVEPDLDMSLLPEATAWRDWQTCSPEDRPPLHARQPEAEKKVKQETAPGSPETDPLTSST